MLYIMVDDRAIKRFSKDYTLIWFPGAVFNISDCRPNDWFFTDCYIHGLLEEPGVSRLLLTMKLPSKPEFTGLPRVNAPKLKSHRCRLPDFCRDIDEVKRTISKPIVIERDERPYSMGLMHLILPQRIFFDERRMRGIAKIVERIKHGILREMLSTICMLKGMPRMVRWIQAYILMGISTSRRDVALFMGDRRIEAKVYRRYIFSNERVLDKIMSVV